MWPFKNKQSEPDTEQVQQRSRNHNYRPPALNNPLQKRSKATDFLSFESANGAQINAVMRTRLPNVRTVSRGLMRENPYAKRYQQLTSDQTVGSQGISIKPVPLNRSGSINVKLQTQLERAFYQWANNAVSFSGGSFTIDTFQQLCEKSRSQDGECLVLLNDDCTVSFIDPVQLPSNNNQKLNNGNYISQSIEYSPMGRVIAYHICQVDPVLNQLTGKYTRIPKDKVLHYFVMDNIGQERGLPDLVASIQALANYDEYCNSTAIARKVSAAAMGFITSDNTSDIPLDDDEDDYNETVEYFSPGSIFKLNPGESIQALNAGQVASDGIQEFSDIILQSIAASLHISKEVLTGTSFSSYSAARMALLLSKQVFRTRSNLLINQVLIPLYEFWLKNFMLRNNMSFVNYDDIKQVQCSLPMNESLDPAKDGLHLKTLLDCGVQSRTSYLKEKGLNPEQIFSEIENEREQFGIGVNKQETAKDTNTNGIESTTTKTDEGDQLNKQS
ncbi:phage portal protein [Salmonella enterica subsp. enterica serovar Gloucester]|nr:phage portal protein [Salmonella enterica subsp. enterica serovar Gloucester]